MEMASLTRNPNAAYSLAPGLTMGTTVQITPQIQSRLQYKWNLGGCLFAEVFWAGERGEQTCRVQTRVYNNGNCSLTTRFDTAVGWAWLNPFRTIPRPRTPSANKGPGDWDANLDEEDDLVVDTISQKGQVSLSLTCSTFDLIEIRTGANCVLSEFSRLSIEVGASWLQGLSLKLTFHRGGQSYVLPVKLSEGWDAAALGYGVSVPTLAYLVTRNLVYEPWINKQMKRLQDARRERLAVELRQQRGAALATQALMQHTCRRIKNAEKEVNGLVIVSALYGQLSAENPSVPLSSDAGGPLSIDVSVPLQVFVENHQVRMPPGRWADQQGFYDPCVGLGTTEPRNTRPLRQLYISYTFNGLAHEVVADEQHGLAIPMNKHRVDSLPTN